MADNVDELVEDFQIFRRADGNYAVAVLYPHNRIKEYVLLRPQQKTVKPSNGLKAEIEDVREQADMHLTLYNPYSEKPIDTNTLDYSLQKLASKPGKGFDFLDN